MPHDPARLDETREWLGRAALDLRGARIDLEADPPLIEDALFHCQQIVEKSLKAFLAWHDVPFRKTHSLEELGTSCERIDPGFKEVVNPAVPLTEYAWAFRYPGEIPTPTLEEARSALAVSMQVAGSVVSRLPAEAIPESLRNGLSRNRER